ncbi:hypothetical protein [Verrucomicrobium spinosum]|nr:hypothetical protein [Verrucomicrobium spinosum]
MTINGIIRSLTVAHNRGVRQAAYEQKLARKRADLAKLPPRLKTTMI